MEASHWGTFSLSHILRDDRGQDHWRRIFVHALADGHVRVPHGVLCLRAQQHVPGAAVPDVLGLLGAIDTQIRPNERVLLVRSSISTWWKWTKSALCRHFRSRASRSRLARTKGMAGSTAFSFRVHTQPEFGPALFVPRSHKRIVPGDIVEISQVRSSFQPAFHQ